METILGLALLILAAVIALRLLAAFARVALAIGIIALAATWWLQPARTGAIVAAVGHHAIRIVERVCG
jgi:hypothetical protein